jgi:hypothetical protein
MCKLHVACGRPRYAGLDFIAFSEANTLHVSKTMLQDFSKPNVFSCHVSEVWSGGWRHELSAFG